jgi:hypothetical protein
MLLLLCGSLQSKLANNFILISGYGLFFITISEPKNRKSFSIKKKKIHLDQVDSNKGKSGYRKLPFNSGSSKFHCGSHDKQN